MQSTNKYDRYLGSFIGLAIGDSLGAPFEFKPRGNIVVDNYLPVTHWNLPAGGWTDDTTMALCLAESLIANETREQTMDRFVKWWTKGYNTTTNKCVDIGGTTMHAIAIYAETGKIDPQTDEHSAGNGCIMRLAPVVIYNESAFGNIVNTMDKCAESCALTHGAPVAIQTTRYMGKLLSLLFEGCAYKNEAFTSTTREFGNELEHLYEPHSFIKKTANGKIEQKFGNITYSEDELHSDGYCVNTLECALWAWYTTDTFEDGMKKVIALGDDADTTGAVYGQIAGAYYGYSGIPDKWKTGLLAHDMIVDLVKQLTTPNVPEHSHNTEN